MKEYLRKNQDGVYVLELSCEQEAQEPHANNWIEVPTGAVKAVEQYIVGCPVLFINENGEYWNIMSDKWCAIDGVLAIREILWQRSEIEKNRTASDIADAALKHIRERASTYDQPTGERSAAKTAMAFNAITGKDIAESEVWLLLQLLKDVRQWSRKEYHQDSAEDCIAYAALKAESLERGI